MSIVREPADLLQVYLTMIDTKLLYTLKAFDVYACFDGC